MPHAFFRVCLLMLLALMVSTNPARAGEAETLDFLRQKTATLTSVKSTFVQTTRIPMFESPVVSQGAFAFARPDRLRWEYTSPIREGFVLNGRTGFRWDSDPSNRTPFNAGSDPVAAIIAKQLITWITLDLDLIRKAYDIAVV